MRRTIFVVEGSLTENVKKKSAGFFPSLFDISDIGIVFLMCKVYMYLI